MNALEEGSLKKGWFKEKGVGGVVVWRGVVRRGGGLDEGGLEGSGLEGVVWRGSGLERVVVWRGWFGEVVV